MEGDEVEILEEKGDWYKVSAKGHTGYVSKAFITKLSEENNTNQQEQPQENSQGQTAEQPQEQQTTEQPQEQQPTEQTQEQQSTETKKAVVTTKIHKLAEDTQVYILPIISSDTIGTIKSGEELNLINSAGLWGFVESNGIKGWVRIDKLSSEDVTKTVEESNEQSENMEENNEEAKTEEINQEENKTEENTEQENNTENNEQQAQNTEQQNNEQPQENTANYAEKTMYVSVAAVNIRKESNTESDVLGGAELNKAYTVVGEENDWYKVKIGDNSFGFIRKDLMSDKKTEETSRSNEIDRTQAAAQKATQQTAQQQASNPAQITQAASSVPVSASGVSGTDIANYAKQFVGCRYVYGAAGPSSFDCSGLTMYVYKHFGYSLSHSSRVQATQGKAVTGALQPGDILVFSNDGKQVGHVGIYIGNDKFVHASDSSTGVIISNLHDRWNISKYWGARRIL